MKLRKVSGADCDKETCPAVYISDRGTGVAQGPLVAEADGLTLGPGEVAVELPLDVLRAAVRALEAEEGTA
ncbi:hypothetical protein GCM10023192_82510 [Amycolatopsis samaneae]